MATVNTAYTELNLVKFGFRDMRVNRYVLADCNTSHSFHFPWGEVVTHVAVSLVNLHFSPCSNRRFHCTDTVRAYVNIRGGRERRHSIDWIG